MIFRLTTIFLWMLLAMFPIETTLASGKNPKPEIEGNVKVSSAKKNEDGIWVHQVKSPLQEGTTQILVLTPDRMDPKMRYPVIYVLPVEAGTGTRWGNGLRHIKQRNLHNKLNVIFVMPTFSHLPWYCDHPTDAKIQQESYFLKVVLPFIEKNYPVLAGRFGRLLLGFSKSGWGAFTLFLRHPDLFEKAAAWDAPLNMKEPNNYGMGPIFGTQHNFEKHQISKLLVQQAKKLKKGKRLALIGYANFRKHHQEIHAQMEKLQIPHQYLDIHQGKHHWESGWIDAAVEFLAGQ